MFGKPKNKEENRYYLLPGMGRGNRQKHSLYFRTALAVGAFLSALIGLGIYLANRPGGIWGLN